MQVCVQRKLTSHVTGCWSAGVEFIPLVAETLGVLAEDTIHIIRSFGEAIAQRVGPQDSTTCTKHLFHRVATEHNKSCEITCMYKYVCVCVCMCNVHLCMCGVCTVRVCVLYVCAYCMCVHTVRVCVCACVCVLYVCVCVLYVCVYCTDVYHIHVYTVYVCISYMLIFIHRCIQSRE